MYYGYVCAFAFEFVIYVCMYVLYTYVGTYYLRMDVQLCSIIALFIKLKPLCSKRTCNIEKLSRWSLIRKLLCCKKAQGFIVIGSYNCKIKAGSQARAAD